MHDYILGNYRLLYTRTLAAGINHFNQTQIILKLLATGKNTRPEHRQEEGALITAALISLPPQRGWFVLQQLRKNRINIPDSGNLAQAYKHELIDRAEKYPYIQLPIINRIFSQQLSINPNNLNYLSIGTELSTGEKQRLFIIPDTIDLMTLNANLGYQDSYLYNSAYHYWNHYTEIQQHYHQRQTKRPLIFIDLDSFGTLKLVPVKIEPVNNSTYKIPVLNTIETIEVNYGFQGIYPKICYRLAQYILSNNFPVLTDDNQSIIHLSKYLQKNNIFAIIQPYLHANSIDLIIEVLSDNQIYYKQVNLLTSTLIAITLKSINFENFVEIANRNREYQFVLISQYNNFVEVKQRLSEFICLNPQVSEFKEIWQKKHELSFPLFAIYLDDK